ncbi:MAG: hypothetical protein Q8R79_05910 [Legionellaceae bacterium]|nr:hypothetical protein [Legionellaceae bacterium]
MNKFNLLIVTLFLMLMGNVSSAINLPDLSKAPLLDSPWKSASNGFSEGYRRAQEAGRIQALCASDNETKIR